MRKNLLACHYLDIRKTKNGFIQRVHFLNPGEKLAKRNISRMLHSFVVRNHSLCVTGWITHTNFQIIPFRNSLAGWTYGVFGSNTNIFEGFKWHKLKGNLSDSFISNHPVRLWYFYWFSCGRHRMPYEYTGTFLSPLIPRSCVLWDEPPGIFRWCGMVHAKWRWPRT